MQQHVWKKPHHLRPLESSETKINKAHMHRKWLSIFNIDNDENGKSTVQTSWFESKPSARKLHELSSIHRNLASDMFIGYLVEYHFWVHFIFCNKKHLTCADSIKLIWCYLPIRVFSNWRSRINHPTKT